MCGCGSGISQRVRVAVLRPAERDRDIPGKGDFDSWREESESGSSARGKGDLDS